MHNQVLLNEIDREVEEERQLGGLYNVITQTYSVRVCEGLKALHFKKLLRECLWTLEFEDYRWTIKTAEEKCNTQYERQLSLLYNLKRPW